MAEYKYHLQKYRTKATRHTCPACGQKFCFKYYVDDDEQMIDPRVGKCDHVSSCGYHYTPGQFFMENPEYKSDPNWVPKKVEIKAKGMMVLPFEYVDRSRSVNSTLVQWMFREAPLDAEKVAEALTMYLIGATKDGWTIFWQIDKDGRVRTGKAMRYKPDGHRDKDESNGRGKGFRWIHNMLEYQGVINRERDNTELVQCLFGLHLLKVYPSKPVAIVESEKSAVIMSCFDNTMIWMATGGMMNLNESMLKPLFDDGRKVILFPDRDGEGKWRDKIKDFDLKRCNLKINPFAKVKATWCDPDNADIADISLRLQWEDDAARADAKRVIENNLNEAEKRLALKQPHLALRELIERLDLVIVK